MDQHYEAVINSGWNGISVLIVQDSTDKVLQYCIKYRNVNS